MGVVIEDGRRYLWLSACTSRLKRVGRIPTPSCATGSASQAQDLERVLDRLVERGRLKPVLFRRVQQAGRASLVCATRESHLRWEA